MMEPPPARRLGGTAYFTDRKTTSRLILVCRLLSANEISTALHRIPMPALATTTSKCPKRRSGASIIPGQLSSRRRSWWKKRASPPALPTRPPRPGLRCRLSPSTTLAPLRSSVAAQAAPNSRGAAGYDGDVALYLAHRAFPCDVLPNPSDHHSRARALPQRSHPCGDRTAKAPEPRVPREVFSLRGSAAACGWPRRPQFRDC
jgi:hypothetical protein